MKSLWQRLTIAVLVLMVLPGCSAMEYVLERTSAPAVVRAEAVPVEVEPAPVDAPATAPLTQGSVLNELEATLAELYDLVNPSVVSIQVTQNGLSTLPDEFKDMPGFSLPQDPDAYIQQAAGSGFVWDTDGHIVTNNHVVADATKITVQFHDGTMVKAELVGADPDSDLAVIKVDMPARELVPVTMGDSTQTRVGQLAVAIGNPFGLKNTMTVGFVSAIGRSLPVEASMAGGPSYTIPDIIQTDAPINPGNSGGVLINERGEVVGVPTAIVSGSGSSSGIGFAVPAAIVNKVVPALIEEGRFTHPWLGISGITLSMEMAEAMGLDADQRGALVIEAVAGGPADNAGVQGSERQIEIDGQPLLVGGDVIVALEDNTVRTFDDLVANLARYRAGETITLTVLRDGQPQDLAVTLGQRPE